MALNDRLKTPASESAHRPRATPYVDEVKYNTSGQPVEAVSAKLTSVPKTEAEWRAEVTRVTGLELPEHRQVTLSQVKYWGNPEVPFVSCRFVITDRENVQDRLDLEELIRAVKRVKPNPKKQKTGRSLVVAWADLQVGKVGSRGDTETLVQRVSEKLDALERLAKSSNCDSVVLVDVGDCVEGFENVASQGFTNDLSFTEQLRVARRLFTDAALRLAKIFPKVTCVSVPSNHGAWRKGKDYLGRPGDDFGIETLIAVADAFALNPALAHVEFVVPDVWEQMIAIDINGTILGVTHGHQANRPERVPEWWAKQVHGGQPAADSDILLTGHFHTLRVQTSGRSVHTGRAKWWIQAPSLDNGSDWYRHSQGDDSDPALLTFEVDADGWSNLHLL